MIISLFKYPRRLMLRVLPTNNFRFESTLSTTTHPSYLVSSFTDLQPWIRRTVLKIHPDVLSSYSEPYIAQNAEALSEIFRLTGLIAARSGISTVEDKGEPFLPNGRGTLIFYVEDENGDRNLRRCSVEVSLPTLQEERWRILATKESFATQAKAHWLHLGCDIITKLCRAAAVKSFSIDTSLLLSKDLLDLIQQKNDKKNQKQEKVSKNEEDPLGWLEDEVTDVGAQPPIRRSTRGERTNITTSYLFANLAENSPLAQGKAYAFPKRGVSGINIFSKQKRLEMTDRVLGKPGSFSIASSPIISKREAALIVQRLRVCMVSHFDALSLYHPLWSGSIQLHVDGPNSNYEADVNQMAFKIPSSFNDKQFVDLIETNFPLFLKHANNNIKINKQDHF
jgi:hypothetical protein